MSWSRIYGGRECPGWRGSIASCTMKARPPARSQPPAPGPGGEGRPDSAEGRPAEGEEPLRASIRAGLEAAWPICIGYLPLGLAFGVLAQKEGLSLLDIALMSAVVFAGSSQFIAVAMLGLGASPLSIILTTFIVNSRHILMSSALAVHLQGLSRSFLSLYAYGITDESFAVNIARFKEAGWHPYRALAVNHTANLAWIGSTILGGYCGQFIAAGSFGIDYALSAMFLSLIVFQLKGRIYAFTALITALVAAALSLVHPGHSFIIIASLLGASLGFALKRYDRRRRGIDG